MSKEDLPAVVETPRMIEPTADLVKQAYDAVIDGVMPPEVGDPAITARAIALRIRSARSFEEAFHPQDLTPWSRYLDEVVTIGGFHLNPSAFEKGPVVYAVVDIARDETGEFEPVQCGGLNVLTQLILAWEQHWYPFRGKLIAKGTSQKFETYWIEAA
jgi:hypothetical protein